MFVLFHHRVCGPLANSLFLRQPTQRHTPTADCKPLITKQTPLSNTSSIYLPLETLRDKFSNLRPKNLKDLQVHHRKYRSRQGDDSLANLVTLCAYCHIEEHGQLSYSKAAASQNSASRRVNPGAS
jgi:5-methylcytosine-specific restriction endonuclease McrA